MRGNEREIHIGIGSKVGRARGRTLHSWGGIAAYPGTVLVVAGMWV